MLPLLLAVQIYTGTTAGAPPSTAQTSCNRGVPAAPEADVSWTAAGNGMATATTCPETTFDSLLFVRGASGEVGCSDDTDSSHDCSTVSWQVATGSVWALGVSGYNGKNGPYTLHVTGPDATSADPCPYPPAYPRDFSGPTCAAAHQLEACRCSECFTWSPSPPFTQAGTSKRIEEYEVWRTLDSIDNWQRIGTVKTRRGGVIDDETGAIYPDVLPAMWCAAWDSSLPAEGVLYRYGVKACGGSPRVCSVGLTSVVRYRGAKTKEIP